MIDVDAIRGRLVFGEGWPPNRWDVQALADARALLDAYEVVLKEHAGQCQFSDATHLVHRPFSERAPICWDCFHAALDAAYRERDEAVELLRALAKGAPFGAYLAWRKSGTTESAAAMDQWDHDIAEARAFLSRLVSPEEPQ